MYSLALLNVFVWQRKRQWLAIGFVLIVPFLGFYLRLLSLVASSLLKDSASFLLGKLLNKTFCQWNYVISDAFDESCQTGMAGERGCRSTCQFKVLLFFSETQGSSLVFFFLPKLEGALGIQWWNFPSFLLLDQSTGHPKDNFYFFFNFEVWQKSFKIWL